MLINYNRRRKKSKLSIKSSGHRCKRWLPQVGCARSLDAPSSEQRIEKTFGGRAGAGRRAQTWPHQHVQMRLTAHFFTNQTASKASFFTFTRVLNFSYFAIESSATFLSSNFLENWFFLVFISDILIGIKWRVKRERQKPSMRRKRKD